MNKDESGYLPLSAATLHILLALAAGDLHGYGIMQEVIRESEGRYKLGPGTLYDNLDRLIEQGLVKDLGRRTDDEDPRRRYYGLTAAGRRVLSAEVGRLEDIVRKARLHLAPRRA